MARNYLDYAVLDKNTVLSILSDLIIELADDSITLSSRDKTRIARLYFDNIFPRLKKELSNENEDN